MNGFNGFLVQWRVEFPVKILFLIKGDLVDALRDYPEDKALLARKSQKARKEVAAKQASNTTATSKMTKDVIFPLNKDPAMVTALLKLIPKSSKVSKLLTYGTLQPENANFGEENEDILVVEKEEITKK